MADATTIDRVNVLLGSADSAVVLEVVSLVEDQLKLNIIGLMGGAIEGKDWPTFSEQGSSIDGTPFFFSKEYRAFYMPEKLKTVIRHPIRKAQE